jgi:hypothetical protein
MLTLDKRRVALRNEKLEGVFGEEGLERLNDLGVLGLLLHWSFGLLGTEQVFVAVAIEVLQRRVDEPVEEG